MLGMKTETIDDVCKGFDNGSILAASRPDLVAALLVIARFRTHNDADQARTAQMGETVRLFIAAKDAEQSHRQAIRIAIVALIVSAAALICSATQAYFAYASWREFHPTSAHTKSN